MSDFCPVRPEREETPRQRIYLVFYWAPGQRPEVHGLQNQEIAYQHLSFSPLVTGCNARDTGLSSCTSDMGFSCPVIKGQSPNGDEQSCNGTRGRRCMELGFLLFWEMLLVQPASARLLRHQQQFCPSEAQGETRCRSTACGTTGVGRTNPTFPLSAWLDEPPWFIKV